MEARGSMFTGAEEWLDFAITLVSVVGLGKVRGTQTQGCMPAKLALPTKLHPQSPNYGGCPEAWAPGLGSRVGRGFFCSLYRYQDPVPA